MDWSIEYYSSEVEKSVLDLPDGLQARYLRLTDLMLEFGPNLGMPHTKAIKDGLFELRIKSKEGIARVFYYTGLIKEFLCSIFLLKNPRKFPRKN